MRRALIIASAVFATVFIGVAVQAQMSPNYGLIQGGGGWVGTATSTLDMVAQIISFGTDPADAGDIRMENATNICWEASPAGTDVCVGLTTGELVAFTGVGGIAIGTDPADFGVIRLEAETSISWEAAPTGSAEASLKVTDNEVFEFTRSGGDTAVVVGNTDPSDSGVVRLENAKSVCWEASPASTDVCMTVDATENISITSTFVSTATSSIGWSIVAGADAACNTTCTSACVMGFAIDAAGGSNPVACTDATADNCLCAGGS
jgi:hypothetical protein